MTSTAINSICAFQLFINNEWVNSVSGKTFATINPATGAKLADIQEADKVMYEASASLSERSCAETSLN